MRPVRLAVPAAIVLAALTVPAVAAPPVPTPIGPSARFRPAAVNPAALAGRPIGTMTCSSAAVRRAGVHVELFAGGRVVLVPAGIGFAAPLRHRGVYVAGGRCSYPLRTREPTGVVEVARGTRATLGDLFAVWGRTLTPARLLGFDAPPGGRVRAYVGGRAWRGDPAAIPLAPHAQIVLQVGPSISPHSTYRFPEGL